MSERGLARRVLKGFAVLAMAGVIAVVGLLASLWFEHRSEITLPTPTGPFAVGRVIYDWTDSATLDTLAPAPGTKRELLVWIWYPSAPGNSAAKVDDYVPAQMQPKGDYASASLPFRLLTRNPSRDHEHSLRGSDLSPRQQSYPVAIMSAGASAAVA